MGARPSAAGFKVDRTGAAFVGAIVLIVTGRIAPGAAWDAIDYGAIGLLFGLMVVSAAFVVSGFYDWAAARIANAQGRPRPCSPSSSASSAAFSALLTNDVVVVAMTPLLAAITLVARSQSRCRSCSASASPPTPARPARSSAARRT